jgi:hypothetical protein
MLALLPLALASPAKPNNSTEVAVCAIASTGTCPEVPLGTIVYATDANAAIQHTTTSGCFYLARVTAVAANGTLGLGGMNSSMWFGFRPIGSGVMPNHPVTKPSIGLGVLALNPAAGCLMHGEISGQSVGATWAVQFSDGSTHANIPAAEMVLPCFPDAPPKAVCTGRGSGSCPGLRVGAGGAGVGGTSRVVVQLKRPSPS